MIYKSRDLVEKIQQQLKKRIEKQYRKLEMAVIVVGDDPATRSFVSIKKRFAQKIGVSFIEYVFGTEVTTEQLITKMQQISSDKKTTALIVQLPLPKSIDRELVLGAIPSKLDVDVLNGETYKVFLETGTPLPPVAWAVLEILTSLGVVLDNKAITIVGMGALVGKPVYDMFLGLGIKPQIIDIDTPMEDRKIILKQADIIISGIGVANSIMPNDIKEGVILIDAGTSEQVGQLKGDISPECAQKASILTAVPGGVGPLTVACLFRNVIEFAEKV